MQRFNIVLAGPSAVGKTAIFNQLLFHSFSPFYQATLHKVSQQKRLQIGGEDIEVNLSDIGGHQTIFDWPPSYCQKANAILYVIDFTQQSIYHHLLSDLDFLRHTYPHCLLKVVVNKVDILKGAALNQELKKHRNWNFDFFVCANNKASIMVLFEELIRALMKRNELQNP